MVSGEDADEHVVQGLQPFADRRDFLPLALLRNISIAIVHRNATNAKLEHSPSTSDLHEERALGRKTMGDFRTIRERKALSLFLPDPLRLAEADTPTKRAPPLYLNLRVALSREGEGEGEGERRTQLQRESGLKRENDDEFR